MVNFRFGNRGIVVVWRLLYLLIICEWISENVYLFFLWILYFVVKVKIKFLICYYCRIILEFGRWFFVWGCVDEVGKIVRKFVKKNFLMLDYLNRVLVKCSWGEIFVCIRKIWYLFFDLFWILCMCKRILIFWFCWWVVVVYYKGRELNKELIIDSFLIMCFGKFLCN